MKALNTYLRIIQLIAITYSSIFAQAVGMYGFDPECTETGYKSLAGNMISRSKEFSAYSEPTFPRSDSGEKNGEKMVMSGDCTGSLRFLGGKEGCGKFLISESFAIHMDKHFNKCVAEGSKKSGISSQIKYVELTNVGTFSDRNIRNHKGTGSAKSLHAVARAIDFNDIIVHHDGGTQKFTVGIKPKTDFELAFQMCWSATIPTGANCEPGKEAYSKGKFYGSLGSEFYQGAFKHLHVSLPYCPKRQGFAFQ